MRPTLSHWQELVTHAATAMANISESEFNFKSGPDQWSKKEILGHLIDSATHNHQRWVRAQFETSPDIRYQQNLWVQHACHAQMPGTTLLQTWHSYNQYLLTLVPLIPEKYLIHQVYQSDTPCTLEASIKDYVSHLEHHLRQILPNGAF